MNNQTPVPEPIATIFRSYCDVNALELVDELPNAIQCGKIAPEKAKLFKEQLFNAVKNRTITPEQYKKLTGENEYTTQDALQSWLRELWDMIYPGEQI